MPPSAGRRRLLEILCAGALIGPRGVFATSGPVRIGVSLGLTGFYAPDSDMQGKAYKLWTQHVNARGGLLGRPLDLIIRDDRGDPDTARRIYQDFCERGQADLVFGPYSSALTHAVAPIADAAGYPMLTPGAAADKIWQQGYRHVFGTILPASRQTIGLLAILSEAGIRTLALVHADDVYSVNLAAGAERWAGEYGVKLTSVQRIARDTADLRPAAVTARQSGAAALIMAGHFNESVNMHKALRQIGWRPAAYYASVGPCLDSYAKAVGGQEEGVLATSTWEAREDLAFPGAAEFLRAFVGRYAETPSFLAAQAYGAGQILEYAVRQAGTLNRAAVRDALAAADTNVIIGRYAVDQAGMLAKRLPLIIQWQKRRREIVWPPSMRTAVPRLGS